jgi:hypothetical protein
MCFFYTSCISMERLLCGTVIVLAALSQGAQVVSQMQVSGDGHVDLIRAKMSKEGMPNTHDQLVTVDAAGHILTTASAAEVDTHVNSKESRRHVALSDVSKSHEGSNKSYKKDQLQMVRTGLARSRKTSTNTTNSKESRRYAALSDVSRSHEESNNSYKNDQLQLAKTGLARSRKTSANTTDSKESKHYAALSDVSRSHEESNNSHKNDQLHFARTGLARLIKTSTNTTTIGLVFGVGFVAAIMAAVKYCL